MFEMINIGEPERILEVPAPVPEPETAPAPAEEPAREPEPARN